MSKTLYILYNADGSVLGKLRYGYKKLSSSSKTCDGPVCSACEITHGGLSLSETPEWVEAKKDIQQNDFKVVQLHRDELTSSISDFVKSNNLRYPTVLLDSGDGNLSTVMNNNELNDCKGNSTAFLEALRKKDILPASDSKSSL